jgi:hypothetical protein
MSLEGHGIIWTLVVVLIVVIIIVVILKLLFAVFMAAPLFVSYEHLPVVSHTSWSTPLTGF